MASRAGHDLARVAERSGLNIGYLSQIENDKAMPSLDALGEIAARSTSRGMAPRRLQPGPTRRARRGPAPVGGGDLAEATEVDGGTSRDLCIIEAVVPAGHRTGSTRTRATSITSCSAVAGA